MIIEREQDVTAAALAVMERTSDPRLRQIMVSLVRHLHAFVRDVRLTEKEFRDAATVIAELGQLIVHLVLANQFWWICGFVC